MKIEKVGWYKRRDGKKARVICVDGVCPWSVVAIDEQGIPTSYIPEGAAWSGNPGGKDLIAPWPDEPVKGSLEWVKTLPPDTMVWHKGWAKNASLAVKVLDQNINHEGWHIVGTSEWANALPEGTKLTRGAWKPKDWIARNGGVWISQLASTHTVDGNGWLIFREPVLRPWKPEEVPVGAVLVAKQGSTVKRIISGVDSEGVHLGGGWCGSFVAVLEVWHLIDGSPCGVMEDAK